MAIYYTIISLIGLLIIFLIFKNNSSNTYTDKEWEDTQDKEWKNRVKKVLYIEKPIAKIQLDPESYEDGYIFYFANTSCGEIVFRIPIEEGNQFKDEEPAQLLIRWLL